MWWVDLNQAPRPWKALRTNMPQILVISISPMSKIRFHGPRSVMLIDRRLMEEHRFEKTISVRVLYTCFLFGSAQEFLFILISRSQYIRQRSVICASWSQQSCLTFIHTLSINYPGCYWFFCCAALLSNAVRTVWRNHLRRLLHAQQTASDFHQTNRIRPAHTRLITFN